MPRYEYICNCDFEPKTYVINLSFSDYKPEIPCPCGDGIAKRKFSSFSVQDGLTAKEKKFGTTSNRKNMADFMKDQKTVRKSSYAPDTRESVSNEIWLGKEGLDGITSMPIERKKD
jgi:hypothetical protein